MSVALHSATSLPGTEMHVASDSKVKSFRSHMGPPGGADIHFRSPQQDTSLYCKTDTGLVHDVLCIYFPVKVGTHLLIPEG